MKSRLPAIIAMSALLVLAACGGDSPPAPTPTSMGELTAITQPTTAPTIAAQTPPIVGEPSPDPATAQAASPTPAVVSTPASAAKETLELAPVPLETTDSTRVGAFAQERTINLPPGFGIRVYATGLDGVRWLGLSPQGVVYATVRGNGSVVTLPDADGDGVADETRLFAGNLSGVHGIAFKDAGVYVATETDIIRLEDTDGDGVADKRDVLASDLPSGGGHSTRTLAFGPDGKLYVSAGSSCNVCVETDEKRAAISRYSAEGQFEKVYAGGLRNAVGIEFHAVTGELWATNNGRDRIGDNLPPETIYNVKEDTHYGWPYCYGSRVPDPELPPTEAGFCERTGVPAVEMQAHSAPLGMEFYTGEAFPTHLRGDLFVAFHGSWNRTVPTGYKVVRVRFNNNQPDTGAGEMLVEDFATGWLVSGGDWGRPVDLLTLPNGTMLLTDDSANAIYQIYYKENAGP